MPKLKIGTVLPTPAEDAALTAAAVADPDAAPFTDAEWRQVKPLVHRGRPLGSGTKAQITLRLDVRGSGKIQGLGRWLANPHQ